MNRSDLHQLQAMRDYPSLSIITPTHRTSPDNLQDPIRVKNLVTEATNQLHDQFSKREVEPLLERLNTLVGQIDWHHTLDGMALFVSKDFGGHFDLPFPVTERVVVDESFGTRELVFSMNRSPRYHVLVLSEHRTHLFEAVRDQLRESRVGGFPLEHEGSEEVRGLPGGHGVHEAGYRDESDRHFFHHIDAELSKMQEHDPLPVVVTGVTRSLALWDELSSNKASLAGTLGGSYEDTHAHELGQLVWPVMEEFMARDRAQILDELGEAIGAQKYAGGMDELWTLALEGRGATLLVEEDFHYMGEVRPNGMLMATTENPVGDETLVDVVDDLIEMVLSKSGRVVFVDNGSLEANGGIALILRY
ncbi:hypothetical protein EON83_13030 [bacterium]|nr:MAG: hypothetical protein EON83_13030 [bacterium]